MKTTNGSDSNQFYWRIAGIVAITLLFILLILLVGFTFKVLLFVLSGILVACFFRGIAKLIHKYTGLSMNWALLSGVAGFFIIVTFINIFLAPSIMEQAVQITEKLPSSIEYAEQYLSSYWWGEKLVNLIPEDPQNFLEEHSGWASQTFGLVSSTFGILADLYIVVLIGIFMMVNPSPYVNGLVHLVPASAQERAREVIGNIYTVLQRWLTGKLMSMLIVAVLTWLGLMLLGVPLPLTLGLLAGTLAFIPNFGPLIALIPAVLLGFLDGPATALYVVILYMIIQVVESNFITPFIQREMVHLPLAMIIIAQVVLGILVGGLGLILATPIVAVIIVLVKMLYVEDMLGQSVEESGEKG